MEKAKTKKKIPSPVQSYTFFVGYKKVVIVAKNKGEAVKLLNKIHNE